MNQFNADLAAFQRQVSAAGLSCCDCSGIVLGNADLEASCVQGDVGQIPAQPAHLFPAITPQAPTPLPGLEHAAALASIDTRWSP